jgi:hypothetical protein
MSVQKYNREELKKKYFSSKYTEVKQFLCDNWVTYNSRARIETKWWNKEKKAMKSKASDKALKKVEEKLAAQLEPSAEFLLWNITKAIELSAVKLKQMEEKWNINVKDLNTIRWMNRIQNNMPTTFVKSENENMNTERIEAIHIVVWANPIDNSKNELK